MNLIITPTLFDFELSDTIAADAVVSMPAAEKLFLFFKEETLFKWGESHNGCEARADAVCVLLQQLDIPNYKAWVFSGQYLKGHVGGLKQNWNYHVAAMLQVTENDTITNYVLDPATSDKLQKLNDWATNVTDYPHSYHIIKEADWYIFSDKKINNHNWHPRNKQNRKWMIQGLAGINGLNAKGKAELCFNKGRIRNAAKAFVGLKQQLRIKN